MVNKPFVLNPVLFGVSLMDIDIYRMNKFRKHYEGIDHDAIHRLCCEELSSMLWTRERVIATYGSPLTYRDIEHFREEIRNW